MKFATRTLIAELTAVHFKLMSDWCVISGRTMLKFDCSRRPANVQRIR